MLAEVCHQERAVQTLRRVLDGSLTSPLLLWGVEGVGRKHSVLCLMRELLCTGEKLAGCECSSCYQVTRGLHPDIVTVGSDVDTIGIEAVRELTDRSRLSPSASDFTCIIVDGADRFASVEAADALLKTLEEPPPRVRLFLLAEDRSEVSATIRSRCIPQRYKELPESFIQGRMGSSGNALVLTRMAEGSLGRALRYANAGKLHVRDSMLKLLQAVARRDTPLVFSLVDGMHGEVELGLRFLCQLVHDLFMVQSAPSRVINLDVSAALNELSSRLPLGVRYEIFSRLNAVQVSSARLALPFHLKTILSSNVV